MLSVADRVGGIVVLLVRYIEGAKITFSSATTLLSPLQPQW